MITNTVSRIQDLSGQLGMFLDIVADHEKSRFLISLRQFVQHVVRHADNRSVVKRQVNPVSESIALPCSFRKKHLNGPWNSMPDHRLAEPKAKKSEIVPQGDFLREGLHLFKEILMKLLWIRFNIGVYILEESLLPIFFFLRIHRLCQSVCVQVNGEILKIFPFPDLQKWKLVKRAQDSGAGLQKFCLSRAAQAKQRWIVASIDKAKSLGFEIVLAKEKGNKALALGILDQGVVQLMNNHPEIGITAKQSPECRLEIGHQKRSSDSFARYVGDAKIDHVF